MTPFLQQVVNAYIEHELHNLCDYCFVLPNKRSAAFLTHFLQESLPDGKIMPAVTTITDFVAEFSDLIEASRYESLFTLYDEYRKQPNVDVDFNRFVFWGDILINDFNDVDRYLVDAKGLFSNVTRLKEIRANYLTEEQASVIKRYWGVNVPYSDQEHLWEHIDYADKPANQGKFAKLWQVLYPLYKGFISRLKDKGLTTQGMLYRKAAESLSPDNNTELPYARYVFVGFNVLNRAEHKIFSRLRNRKCADFYWDFISPIANEAHNRAGRFISRNMRDFPSRYPLEEDDDSHFPHTEILGVPSRIAQTKMAGEQLSQWIKSGAINNVDNAIDTAVVLPDESLLIPLIHSLPDKFDSKGEDIPNKINVTMGFPLRNSPISSIMKSIISLQMRARIREADGSISYYMEDVESILTTPGIMSINPAAIQRLWVDIENKRLFNVPAQMIISAIPELSPIFAPIVRETDINDVVQYLRNLCKFMLGTLPNGEQMQRKFIDTYVDAVEQLYDVARQFDINMNQVSFFRLIERAVNSTVVNFFGEPLHGLQIMGMLETRALDFNNVIMISMNERVFPRKHYTRSFIPDALRRDSGLPTIDFQESIFAYYFYRLISRANNVTLIYDSRKVGGTKSNGISRYPAQMLYLFGNRDITHRNMVYKQCTFPTESISIPKSDHIIQKLESFKAGGEKALSASSINKYINCPLWFYLEEVEDYRAPDDIYDFMDAATYGTIFHHIAQKFYDHICSTLPAPDSDITAEMLRPYTLDTDLLVKRLIVREINTEFHHLPQDKCDTPLLGQSLLLGKIIEATFRKVIEHDLANTPFRYIGSEVKDKGILYISPTLSVNFTQIIDRIDITDGKMRFIDYKTGGDTLVCRNLNEMFATGIKDRPKAILQLLLYCHFYKSVHGYNDAIMPLIYPLKQIYPKGIPPLRLGKDPILDYRDIEDQFLELLRDKVSEIFDKKVPFTQSPDTHACTFCKFRPICNRELGEH
ncbi:MAG: PD-(D/E)XK nuclease family protein [Paramuribaculum sp.]|nr:PD-(D/E)XK nuclease family protein [Paramuribaculum sp.]